MSRRAIIGRTLALVALTTSLVGITVGTANAAPDACSVIMTGMSNALDGMEYYASLGDHANRAVYRAEFTNAYRLYRAYNCGA